MTEKELLEHKKKENGVFLIIFASLCLICNVVYFKLRFNLLNYLINPNFTANIVFISAFIGYVSFVLFVVFLIAYLINKSKLKDMKK